MSKEKGNNASFDENGHLIQPFKNCPTAIKKAKACLSDPICEDFSYNTKDCKFNWHEKQSPSISCKMTRKSGENNMISILQNDWKFTLTFAPNLIAHWCSTLDLCPKGYHWENGHAHGATISNAILLSLEDCASECQKNSECNSFEHNMFNDHCILNGITHPNRVRFKEYVFCSKEGNSYL